MDREIAETAPESIRPTRGWGSLPRAAACLAVGWVCAVVLAGAAAAQTSVVRDGTLGPGAGRQPISTPTPTGVEVQIDESLGLRRGSNLFHSFERFDIGRGDGVHFSADPGVDTDTVLSRVTGGSASQISGQIRSSVPGADVFLLNPAGVVFGEGASLDVDGAFHASTADSVELGSDGFFSARPEISSVLSSAPPSAFGFLSASNGGSNGAVAVDGAALDVDAGQALWLTASDVEVGRAGTPTALTAPEGAVATVAVGSNGARVEFDVDDPLGRPRVDRDGSGGGSVFVSASTTLDTSSATPGAVHVSAAEAELRGRLASDSQGSGGGGEVRVDVVESLVVAGSLSAEAQADGDAGRVAIVGRPEAALESGALVSTRSQPTSGPTASGDAGLVEMRVRRLSGAAGARIDASAGPDSTGAAGRIELDAQRRVVLRGSGAAGLDFADPEGELAASGLFAASLGGGDGGSIEITGDSPKVVLSDGATITTATVEGGGGGEIRLAGRQIGVRSGSVIDASTASGDSGGDVVLRARDKLVVRGAGNDGAPSQVRSLTSGDGPAGSIRLRAPEVELLDGALVSTLALPVFGNGRAGDIRIEGDRIRVESGAAVDSSTFGSDRAGDVELVGRSQDRARKVVVSGSSTRILAKTGGDGAGGDVRVEAEQVEVEDGASVSTRSATGLGPARRAVDDLRTVVIGSTDVSAALDALDDPDRTVRGSGGTVVLDADRSVAVRDARIGSIATSRGDAGEVRIETPRLRLQDGADIVVSTSDRGAGGRVEIEGFERLRMQRDAAIEARSQAPSSESPGDAGTVRIQGRRGGQVRIEDSRVETSAEGAGGGGIAIVLDGVATVARSDIQTDVRSGDRNAGNIVLAASSLTLEDSRVIANAQGGDGGSIEILARDFRVLGDTVIEASSEVGTPGRTAVRSPEELLTTPPVLPEEQDFLDPLTLLRRACAARAASDPVGELTVSPSGPGADFWPVTWAPDDARGTGSAAVAVDPAVARARRISESARRAAEAGDDGEASRHLGELDGALADIADAKARAALQIHAAGTWAAIADARSGARAADATLASHDRLQDASQRAAALGDDRLRSTSLGHLSELYRREGRLEEALFLVRRAGAAAERAAAPEIGYRWSWLEGRIEWERGQSNEAVAALRRAVNASELSRSSGRFRREVAPLYLDLVGALLDSAGRVEGDEDRLRLLREARATMERLKVAELIDYFRDECVAALEAKTTPIDALSDRAAIVYPVALHDRLELLVSAGGELRSHRVDVPSEQVIEVARRFRSGVENRVSQDYREPAAQLYDWLVRPYAASLDAKGLDTLVFVPDGILGAIPIAALLDGNVPLAERYALAVTPGLSLIEPRPLRRDRLRPVLAGLSEPVAGFAPLGEVASELKSIREIAGGEVLLNADFEADSLAGEVASRRPALLHIASHARFTGDPDSSFLLAHDGPMSMEALASIVGQNRFRDEPVELLTLSACETAAGDERAALGLAGMAVRAGARSAVGSLWTVDDAAARQLVVEFYRQLLEPDVSRAEALRRAQLELRRDERFAHPYYWSAFLMISDWL